jgi:succinate dehydrogenase/fumarate reductase flavoprotein subunit
VRTTENAQDALPDGLVDAVVIGGGAAGLNGALMLARSRRSSSWSTAVPPQRAG